MNIKSKSNINNKLPIIDITNPTKHMDLIKSLIFSTEETNINKIRFIKEEINNETYEINCKTIATKILEYAIIGLQINEIEAA